jgi:UDP-N-acetylglucosamine 4,6-dehydratase
MKTLLIFGGSGSLGYSLIEKYKNIYKIIIVSRDETKHWIMKQIFVNYNIIWELGCIRNKTRVEEIIFKHTPNIIIIASAMKHIDQCENSIDECINTNILGIQNIINTIYINSLKNQIGFLETVLFISTDKACSPVNAYGMCKALSERIIIEKSNLIKSPKMLVVRYGNVITSRGSLLPFFHDIGIDDNSVFFPVTDNRMTRFFMTLDDSIKLIDTAINEGKSGDTYIPIVKSYKILDIAEMFSKKYNKPIKETKLRPGEKLYEQLINLTEIGRTIKKDSNYIIKPCYKNISTNELVNEYTSNNFISDVNELSKYINT